MARWSLSWLTIWSLAMLVGIAQQRASVAADAVVIDSVVLRPLVEAEVPARQTGVLASIAVEEGASVQAGDLLASLDDRAAKLAVAKAELERAQVHAKATNELRIEYADKALEVARAEMMRSSESNDKFARSISQSQLDVERLTVEKLELERRQAEHDLEIDRFELQLKENAVETAKLDLDLHGVRAPFAGVVALVRGRAGEWVEPGAPVLRLVAVDRLRAEGFAPASILGKVAVGSRATFAASRDNDAVSAAGGVEGVLKFISPEIDPVTSQVRVWAEIDNRQGELRPGEHGELKLQTTEAN
ncbi:multidrug resistance protein MdtN [Lacipirellula limnantheis]|uniref:Multidrug resistance protein MdtN n=2 Tax=Lacipirellula limnantheis TaxID=2528024 RepID=A0A517U5L0_9BACT|nr:multidrug resistance protein MdtN [Lacipirellula limnantheis]